MQEGTLELFMYGNHESPGKGPSQIAREDEILREKGVMGPFRVRGWL